MTQKQQIEMILQILIIFLGILFILTAINGRFTIFMIIGALSVTYITLHYWQKKLVKSKSRMVKVK